VKKIKIGRVTGAQGLRGEIRIYHDSGDEAALRRLSSLFLVSDSFEKAFFIQGLRMQKRIPVLKLEGIDDRSAAEALTGLQVYALLDEARPDEEDAWLVSDLIGLNVRIAGGSVQDEAEAPGSWRICDIIPNPAHDILEIETDRGVRLLPLVDAFIREIDVKAGFMVIIPPDGWID